MNDVNAAEESLRAENEELKRQLEEQKRLHQAGAHPRKGPSAGALIVMALVAIVAIVAGFFVGYLPRQRREEVLAAESSESDKTLPTVNFALAVRSAGTSDLVLPGNIQAVTEGPILARATGYIRKRNVDIGDRVTAGQVVAEIEAPELDQQILQASAALEQTRSAVQQAEAGVQQGRSNENLAHVTAQRWDNLQKRGVVSRQENDTYQAQYAAQQANVQALEKALAASKSNVAAAEANVARLNQLKTYQVVRAPFEGVITMRNVDTGALVNEGNTLLFRMAQTTSLRVYVNLPQSDADNVRVGQRATLTIAELPGKKFEGEVARTANALDPASRTMLTEVRVPNPGGQLMPGMFAEVNLHLSRKDPPILIPGDTMVVRSDGPQVAVIGPGDIVHFAHVQLGRDFGDRLEALSGVKDGDRLATNPSDAVHEGAKVKPVTVEREIGAKKQ